MDKIKMTTWHYYTHSSLSDIGDNEPCRAFGECASCMVLKTMEKIRLDAETYTCECKKCTECVRRDSLLNEVTGEKRINYAKKFPCECLNAYERCKYGNRYWCGDCGFGIGGMMGKCGNNLCQK